MEATLREHYEALWGAPSREASFRKAAATVTVLKWDATERTGDVVVYASLGGWKAESPAQPAHRQEYVLGLLPELDDSAATFALLGGRGADLLGDGDSLQVEGGLWAGTGMDSWLLAEPRSPLVPELVHDGLHVRWLQAVPLYPSERTWKVVNGAARLWAAWEAAGVRFWDPRRPVWSND